MQSRTCRKCYVPLALGDNWSEGQMRARTYMCRTCMSEKGKAHYANNVQRSLELQRARLSQPSKQKEASALRSAYYAANRDKWKQYRATQKAKEDSAPWHRASRLASWIRARAGRCGMEFDLTKEWIAHRIEAGHCEVTGIAFDLARVEDRRFHPWAPSVDRIDSKKGYTQDNCRVVCWIYNIAKSEWNDETVVTFARALVEKQGNRHGDQERRQAG